MTATSHVILVEDDLEIRTLIGQCLRENNWKVFLAKDGREMESILATEFVDLILLDIMLPGEDGLSICRRLRVASNIPIIIISAKGDDIDRVIGLEMGADDYISKPFNPKELVARVRALIRRSSMTTINPKYKKHIHKFGGWTIDIRFRTLENPNGTQITLTPAEFDLLRVFCERPNRLLTREQLIDLSHGSLKVGFSGPSTDRSIDILISRLRRKMELNPSEPKFIRTVRSGGYEFMAEVISE